MNPPYLWTFLSILSWWSSCFLTSSFWHHMPRTSHNEPHGTHLASQVSTASNLVTSLVTVLSHQMRPVSLLRCLSFQTLSFGNYILIGLLFHIAVYCPSLVLQDLVRERLAARAEKAWERQATSTQHTSSACMPDVWRCAQHKISTQSMQWFLGWVCEAGCLPNLPDSRRGTLAENRRGFGAWLLWHGTGAGDQLRFYNRCNSFNSAVPGQTWSDLESCQLAKMATTAIMAQLA